MNIPGEWRTIVENNTGIAPLRNDGSNTHSRLAADIREDFKNYFLNEGAIYQQWILCNE